MKRCEEFLDEILAPGLLSKESEAHIEACEECRALRNTARALGEVGSFEPSDRRARLEKSILGKVDGAILGQPAESAPAVRPSFPMIWKMALAGVFLLMAIVLPLVRSPVTLPPPDLSAFDLSIDGGPFRTVSIAVPVALEKGRAEIRSPDGSKHDFSGPGKAQVFPRGLEITSGQMHCSVVPASTTFFVKTPHGRVEVLGTEFLCRVEEEKTRISLIQGRLEVFPNIGTPTILVAGQEISMIKSTPVVNYREGTAPRTPEHE